MSSFGPCGGSPRGYVHDQWFTPVIEEYEKNQPKVEIKQTLTEKIIGGILFSIVSIVYLACAFWPVTLVLCGVAYFVKEVL